jgi:16S rRNA (adenine1518-N6/adenine1519-N6)-dimethyltransferase
LEFVCIRVDSWFLKLQDSEIFSPCTKPFDNEHGFNPRGDLGQNFLIDLNIIEFIVEEAELTADDVVLEVGSGTGGMTTFMAVAAGHVVSVEYDNNMYGLAKAQTENFENVTLINTDALKNKNQLAPEVIAEVQKQLDAKPGRRLKLVANLPYNIATPIISNLVATELPWARIVATIQLELAERMISVPRDSKYGSLAAWLQAQAKVKLIKRMPPTIFWPRPKVDSAVVKITPRPELREKIVDRAFYQDFVRRSFQHRRKHLRSVVCGMYRKQTPKATIDAVFAAEGLVTETRAEELEVAQLVSLSNSLKNAILLSE